ncbi:hypothetical protein T03_12712 [Trichinella britovi]|uniref:Uncharacterized protein n=1 Tax=Trichinella britovi TaxID=45882 RepID=A0A0V1D7W2_TRIBR|nr:hypothetical protein T03_12712 [Trichinella britovi]
MEDCTSLFSIFRQRQSCLATSNCTRSSHLPTEKSSLIEAVTGYVSILICLFIWCRFVKEVFADISCVVILAIVKDHLGICLFKESISCSTGENLRFAIFEEIYNFTIGNNDNQPTANSCILSPFCSMPATERSGHLEPQLRLAIERRTRRREAEKERERGMKAALNYSSLLFLLTFTQFYDMKGRVAH